MAQRRIIKDNFKKATLKFPKLKLIWQEDVFLCCGEVDVFDHENVYWDSFNIEIKIPIKSYPYQFPTLFLTDGRLPIDDERHVNADMSCCVEVEQKQLLRAKKGITILQFLDEYVVPYFASQLYYEKKTDWAGGEYKHGFDGSLQYYQELTGILETSILSDFLKNIWRYKNMGMYDDCFCGSGRKLKFCHKVALKEILMISPKKIESDIAALERMLERNNEIKSEL